MRRSARLIVGETLKVMAQAIEPLLAGPLLAGPLRLEQSTLSLPLRDWLSEWQPHYPRPLLTGEWPESHYYYREAQADWPQRLQHESPVEAEINVLPLREAALCTHPGEPFVEFGLQVRESSPARVTLFAWLTGGHIGYAPAREAFAHGGYETWTAPTSQLRPEAGEQIVEETRCLPGQSRGRS